MIIVYFFIAGVVCWVALMAVFSFFVKYGDRFLPGAKLQVTSETNIFKKKDDGYQGENGDFIKTGVKEKFLGLSQVAKDTKQINLLSIIDATEYLFEGDQGKRRKIEEIAKLQAPELQPLFEGFINVNQLAKIEGLLEGLEQVIVVAHQIEEPLDGLRTAVAQNLSRGVRYDFLISQSNARSAMAQNYRHFLLLAEKATTKWQKSIRPSDLIRIRELSCEWDDYPVIFFKMNTGDGVKTIAFRGRQEKEGIADNYLYLPPSIARMLVRAIMSGAPRSINRSIRPMLNGRFENVQDVILEQDLELDAESILPSTIH